ncbi:bah domain-containing protein [Diaporthe amygdali]|uniref:bah domain-containing protein n=1 Tax=Phomopsis amygdali TaxID=1214568 RepID=UPI0022FE8794|nr:bah domain-containing protein [Diaporthe amygdali]KAJ0103770.1 bah domain-containing protein [Diaporthe amygdali]
MVHFSVAFEFHFDSGRTTKFNGSTYQPGDYVFIANEETLKNQYSSANDKQLGPHLNYNNSWVARVVQIRARDEFNVYVSVCWMYWPDEVPRGTKIGNKLIQGRQPYHGHSELIASNHSKCWDTMIIQHIVTDYQLQWVSLIEKCNRWLHEECLRHQILLNMYTDLQTDEKTRVLDTDLRSAEQETNNRDVEMDGAGNFVGHDDGVEPYLFPFPLPDGASLRPRNGYPLKVPICAARGRRRKKVVESVRKPYEGQLRAEFNAEDDVFEITYSQGGDEGERRWRKTITVMPGIHFRMRSEAHVQEDWENSAPPGDVPYPKAERIRTAGLHNAKPNGESAAAKSDYEVRKAHSLSQKLKIRRLQRAIREFHNSVHVEEIERQLKGIKPPDVIVPPTIQYDLTERARLARLLSHAADFKNMDELQDIRTLLIQSLNSGITVLANAVCVVAAKLGTDIQLPEILDCSLWRDTVKFMLRFSMGQTQPLRWGIEFDNDKVLLEGTPSDGRDEWALLCSNRPISISYEAASQTVQYLQQRLDAAAAEKNERKAQILRSGACIRDILYCLTTLTSSIRGQLEGFQDDKNWLEAYGKARSLMRKQTDLVFGAGIWGSPGRKVSLIELKKVIVEASRRHLLLGDEIFT